MPFLSFQNIVRNITALFAEGLGAGLLVLIGAGCASLAGPTAFHAALGYGLGMFILVTVLLFLTGAMVTPGAVLLKLGLWMTNLCPRTYYTHMWLDVRHHHRVKHTHVSYLQYVMDVGMALLFIGFQLGGALLGVLLLKECDLTGLLKASSETKPFGNLAKEDGRAFLLAWVLNSAVLLAYGVTTHLRHKKKFQILLAPKVVGAAVFVGVFVSYTFGVGTVLSFASDLALAIVVPEARSRLWISAVSQVAAAVTVFGMMWFIWLQDSWTKHEILHHTFLGRHRHLMHPVYHEDIGSVLDFPVVTEQAEPFAVSVVPDDRATAL